MGVGEQVVIDISEQVIINPWQSMRGWTQASECMTHFSLLKKLNYGFINFLDRPGRFL